MRAAELFRTAVVALASNPLRSGLTTLGIIIVSPPSSPWSR